MEKCKKCKKILFTTNESPTLEVIGELKINIFCQSCGEMNYVKLFGYSKVKKPSRPKTSGIRSVKES